MRQPGQPKNDPASFYRIQWFKTTELRQCGISVSIEMVQTTILSTMASSIDDIPSNRDTSDILTPIPYSEFTKLDEYLKIWYGGLSPRYVDLVSDFAGQEFFLLDGEALTQSVFNDCMLHLAGTRGGMHPQPVDCYVLLTSGFQMLHFIYLVERFLLNLIRRRCFFSVVFFNGKAQHNFVECRLWESIHLKWVGGNNVSKNTCAKTRYSTHLHGIVT